MSIPDNLATLARCRALALAAMIEAGGKPCWVVPGREVAATAGTAATATLSGREQKKLAGLPAKVLAAIERALGHLPEAAKAAPVPACSAPTIQATRRRVAIVPSCGSQAAQSRGRKYPRF